MIGFLRFVGIVNAAIWFGAAVFFTLATPIFFSEEARRLFPPPYNGIAAEMIISRFFLLQHWCGAIALLHLAVERLYLGRVLERFTLGLLITIFCLNLFGGFWLQPNMRAWHLAKYRGTTAEQREEAGKTFGMWHGISQMTNLFVMSGLLFYLWRVTAPNRPSRLPTYKMQWQ